MEQRDIGYCGDGGISVADSGAAGGADWVQRKSKLLTVEPRLKDVRGTFFFFFMRHKVALCQMIRIFLGWQRAKIPNQERLKFAFTVPLSRRTNAPELNRTESLRPKSNDQPLTERN